MNKTIYHPHNFWKFFLCKFTAQLIFDNIQCTKSCKLSYILGVHPIFTRNKKSLNVFIFPFALCWCDCRNTPENTFQMMYHMWTPGSQLSILKNPAFTTGLKELTCEHHRVTCTDTYVLRVAYNRSYL